jgi:hypothetical protein
MLEITAMYVGDNYNNLNCQISSYSLNIIETVELFWLTKKVFERQKFGFDRIKKSNFAEFP